MPHARARDRDQSLWTLTVCRPAALKEGGRGLVIDWSCGEKAQLLKTLCVCVHTHTHILLLSGHYQTIGYTLEPHGQKLLYQRWVLKIDHRYPLHEPVVFPSLNPPPLPSHFSTFFPAISSPSFASPHTPPPLPTHHLHRGTICHAAGDNRGPPCHEGKTRQQITLRGELDFSDVCVLLCAQELVNLAWKQFSFKTAILC